MAASRQPADSGTTSVGVMPLSLQTAERFLDRRVARWCQTTLGDTGLGPQREFAVRNAAARSTTAINLKRSWPAR